MVKEVTAVAWLILTFVSANAFDLDSLLTKSVGGQAAVRSVREIESYHLSGSIVLNGKPGRFVQHLVLPNLYYMEMNFEDFSIVQGYDGLAAWQKDLNGNVAPVDGHEKNEMLRNIYLGMFAHLFPERIPGDRSYLGAEEVEGESYHKVAFYPLEDDTTYLYFDMGSGLLRLTVSTLDNITVYTYLDRYRRAYDLLFSFHSKAVVKALDFFIEVEIEQLKINQVIDRSIFKMPAGVSGDYRFADNAEKLVVPFEYRHGHIRLPIVINGTKKVWMILDSGASTSIFHKPAVSSLDLPLVGKLPAMGVGGFDVVELVRIDSIRIGDLILFDQVTGNLKLSGLALHSDREMVFGGLLGYDFLSRFPIMIDYDDSALTVFNPEFFETPPGGVAVDFSLTMQVPTIRGEINGIAGDFIVDLGNAFGLVIHSRFARANKLEETLSDIRETPRLLGGIGGAVAGKSAFAATFRIGDILVQSLRVLLPDSADGISGSAKLAGNIGNLVLENFRVLFDYGNRRLVFYDTGS